MFGPRTRVGNPELAGVTGCSCDWDIWTATAVAALGPSTLAGQRTFREREPAGSPRRRRPRPRLRRRRSPPPSSSPPPPASGGAGEPVLAVDREQHEPCGVRGISDSVPERGVPAAGGGASGGAALTGRQCDPLSAVGRPAGGVGSPASGSRVSGVGGPAFGGAAVADAPRRAGDVFRDCPECPEMVVLAGGVLAMGRYEVTVGEYRAFASATGGGAGGRMLSRWMTATPGAILAFRRRTVIL